MKLFVDDIRQAPDDWALARTNTKAIRILSSGIVNVVSLDHDIACYLVGGQSHTSNETFMPVAYYISVMPESLRPNTVYIHTANPLGRDKIKSLLTGKVQNIIDDWSFGEDNFTRKDAQKWEDKRTEME